MSRISTTDETQTTKISFADAVTMLKQVTIQPTAEPQSLYANTTHPEPKETKRTYEHEDTRPQKRRTRLEEIKAHTKYMACVRK